LSSAKETDLLNGAVIQITGCLLALRRAVRIVASQPTLMMSQDDLKKFQEAMEESDQRMQKLFDELDKLLGLPRG
jgi:hypothetical protein